MNEANFELIEHWFHKLSDVSPSFRSEQIRKLQIDDSIKIELQNLFATSSKTSILDKAVTKFMVEEDICQLLEFSSNSTVGDFRIIAKIGSGGFANVYIAEDMNLRRPIALKVSPRLSKEAIHIAQLDHPHIVQVYSADALDQDHSFVCMQLVSGCDLAQVIRQGSAPNSGKQKKIAEIVDRECKIPPAFQRIDVANAGQRIIFQKEGLFAFGTRIFAEVSEALYHAHLQGIVHLDVKPANILISKTGHPFLTDFNVSSSNIEGEKEFVGGTLKYLAPELKKDQSSYDGDINDAVTPACDQYSLGRVASELFEPLFNDEEVRAEVDPRSKSELKMIIAKMENPNPQKRFADLRRCADYFNGLRLINAARTALPPIPFAADFIVKNAAYLIVVLALLPQVFASAVNIALNRNILVAGMSAEGLVQFHELVVLYNIIVYPLALLVLVFQLRNLFKQQKLSQTVLSDQSRLRSASIRTIFAFLVASSIGWLPGAFIFPFVLKSQTTLEYSSFFGQFVLSFVISWLIAFTYTGMIVELMVSRCFLPYAIGLTELGSKDLEGDLRRMGSRVALWKNLSILIPLFLAVTFLYISPSELAGARKIVLIALVCMGIFGMVFSLKIEKYILNVLSAFRLMRTEKESL